MAMTDKLSKMTPVLIVDSIEACLPSWRDALGYAVTTEVPHGEKLGFVILQQGNLELMLQTRASIAADLPVLVTGRDAPSILLYADVADLDGTVAELKGAEILVKKRKTFYGAHEVWVRMPSGHVLGLAQF